MLVLVSTTLQIGMKSLFDDSAGPSAPEATQKVREWMWVPPRVHPRALTRFPPLMTLNKLISVKEWSQPPLMCSAMTSDYSCHGTIT